MEDRTDFTTTLRAFMVRMRRSNSDLAQLTGISINTIEKWTTGIVRRPRFVADVLKLARALTLNAEDTTTLLIAARHPPLGTLHAQAQQSNDSTLHMLLEAWALAAPSALVLPPAPRHHLRAPVADFVGRTHEIEQLLSPLRRALAEQRGAIISGVLGMGGIGKTELAYVIAHQLRDSFPDAQIVLNLRGSSTTALTPEQTLQTVIHSLSPKAQLPPDLPSLEQHYRTALHNQRALILADDAADARQVGTLIPPAGSALLITSRQRFSLPGMVTMQLEQLQANEAIELLRAICPRLNALEAERIARCCGYLPLALRMSGSILHTFPAVSVATYSAQLSDEHQRLKALHDPDAPHLNVEASLMLSYAQLEAGAQQVFRQLGVMVADFTTTLAQAMVGALQAGAIDATLQLLLRRNLLMYDTERTRWRLHDLVRDLARQLLEASREVEAAQWRYARVAIALAQDIQEQYQAGGDTALLALAQFDAERAHIDAARRWAQHHAGTPEGDRLLLDAALATISLEFLRYDTRHERIPLWEHTLAAAQRLGNRHAEGQILIRQGLAAVELGAAQRAITYYEQAVTIAHDLADDQLKAMSLNFLGTAYVDLGNARHAIPYLEQAIAIFHTLGNRRHEGVTLDNVGCAYAILGESWRAITYYEQSLIIFRELDDRRREGIALQDLAEAYVDLSAHRRASEFCECAIAIFHALGDQRHEGVVLSTLAHAYADLGDTGRAIRCSERSRTIMQAIGDRRQEAYALSALAYALAQHGDVVYATSTFAQAMLLFQEVGDRWGAARGQWQIGMTLTQHGERECALSLLHTAVAYQQEIGHAKAAEHAALVARLESGEELPPELRFPKVERAIGDNPGDAGADDSVGRCRSG